MGREDGDKEYSISTQFCFEPANVDQFFSLSNDGELRREDVCADVPSQSGPDQRKVKMMKCHGLGGNQAWELLKNGHLLHKSSGNCLDTLGVQSGDEVYVAPCKNIPSQIWAFDNYETISPASGSVVAVKAGI